MKLKTFAIILASALTVLPPGIAASSACQEASDALDAELEASGYEITRAVAQAMKETVEACPTPIASTSLPNIPTSVPDRGEVAFHVNPNPGLAASTCGFTGLAKGHHDDAPLTVYRMLMVYTSPVHENGPADVTFNPLTGVASYEVQGPTHGLSVAGPAGVNGAATGHIFIHGIGIPAARATVDTGCGVNDPTLCWGVGYAEQFVNNIGIAAISAFNHC